MSAFWATAQNNAGLGLFFLGEREEAAAALARAAGHWGRMLERLGSQEIELAGRSSAHHLRLAERHHEAYRGHLRARYERLLRTGAAITTANLRPVRGAANDGRARADQDLSVIVDTLGSRSLEASTLRELAGETHSGLHDLASGLRAKAVMVRKLVSELASHASLPFQLEIEAAAHLTGILHPRLVGAGQEGVETTGIDED
ncbi:MAG: hypothetical protein WC807_12265 [Hyphomicrobium sp.]